VCKIFDHARRFGHDFRVGTEELRGEGYARTTGQELLMGWCPTILQCAVLHKHRGERTLYSSARASIGDIRAAR